MTNGIPIRFGSRNHPVPTQHCKLKDKLITIREGKPEDAPRTAAFIIDRELEEQGRENPGHPLRNRDEWVAESKSYLDTLIEDPDGTLLIAETADKQLVGTAGLKEAKFFENMLDTPRVGFVSGCYVAPGLKGQGLGRKMLDELERVGKLTFTDMLTEASQRAVGFYRKLGFTSWEEDHFAKNVLAHFITKTRQAGSGDLVLMEKNLDPKDPWGPRLERTVNDMISNLNAEESSESE